MSLAESLKKSGEHRSLQTELLKFPTPLNLNLLLKYITPLAFKPKTKITWVNGLLIVISRQSCHWTKKTAWNSFSINLPCLQVTSGKAEKGK